MMSKRILVTGGAGFVGSHTVDALVRAGHKVRVFDNLDPQVHPNGLPAYLRPEVEMVRGDMRDLGGCGVRCGYGGDLSPGGGRGRGPVDV